MTGLFEWIFGSQTRPPISEIPTEPSKGPWVERLEHDGLVVWVAHYDDAIYNTFYGEYRAYTFLSERYKVYTGWTWDGRPVHFRSKRAAQSRACMSRAEFRRAILMRLNRNDRGHPW